MSNFSPPGVARAKADMRAAVLAARRSLPEDRRQRFDGAIAAALAPLVRGRVVAAYVPLRDEPGGRHLLASLASAERVLLPVQRPDRDLDWAAYTGPDALVAGRLGVREPDGPRLGTAAVAEASLIVVPAVAVDRYGIRLGRGGGSYDRVLGRRRTIARALALLYPGEVVDRVPSEPHDRPVDGAITPDGVWYSSQITGRGPDQD